MKNLIGLKTNSLFKKINNYLNYEDYNNNEIGKVLINQDYPFALIKYLDENFNGKSDFNTKEASITIKKPDWIKA